MKPLTVSLRVVFALSMGVILLAPGQTASADCGVRCIEAVRVSSDDAVPPDAVPTHRSLQIGQVVQEPTTDSIMQLRPPLLSKNSEVDLQTGEIALTYVGKIYHLGFDRKMSIVERPEPYSSIEDEAVHFVWYTCHGQLGVMIGNAGKDGLTVIWGSASMLDKQGNVSAILGVLNCEAYSRGNRSSRQPAVLLAPGEGISETILFDTRSKFRPRMPSRPFKIVIAIRLENRESEYTFTFSN